MWTRMVMMGRPRKAYPPALSAAAVAAVVRPVALPMIPAPS